MIEASPTTQARTQAPPRVEQRRSNWRTSLLGLHSILSFIFLYAPIVVLVLFSFTNDSLRRAHGRALRSAVVCAAAPE